MRFLIKLYRKLTGRGIRYYIYMKSGNVIVADFKELSWDYTGDTLSILEWETSIKKSYLKLRQIDVDQVEAIVERNW